MRRCALALAIVATARASSAAARDRDEPAAAREPDAQDVAMTPLNDLNLSKDEIPPVLLAAADDPYASAGLDKCPAIEAAIGELDGALGPDMDVALNEGERLSTGRMAKSVVASFIPFRGILREVTGAAGQERLLRAAIYAGAVRRGFLKGLGQQKGCAYPARPAFARVTVAAPPRTDAKPSPPVATGEATTFVSEPVVQAVPRRRR
jgi:hypothetical protein